MSFLLDTLAGGVGGLAGTVASLVPALPALPDGGDGLIGGLALDGLGIPNPTDLLPETARTLNVSSIIGNNTNIVYVGLAVLAGIVLFGKKNKRK